MNTIDAIQGNQEWLDIRAKHFTASEAPAMMGASKYTSRTDLLKQKATGITEEVDANKQRLFDRGHAAEAAARPVVEAILGEELYPATGTLEVDGLPLLASFDGLTMLEDRAWENKLFNATLADSIRAGQIEPHYYWQLEQQLLVSGAEKVYFTTSDGTKENTVGMWYESIPERRAALIAGWKQFAEDLAAYEHVPETVKPVAETIEALPALAVSVTGSISLTHNLERFGQRLTAFVKDLNDKPETDQDFVNLDAAVKVLKEAESALDAAESNALAQTTTIADMCALVATYRKMARDNRIMFEKIVKTEKENRKAAIINDAVAKIVAHNAKLNERIGGNWMPSSLATASRFIEAAKGLKSLDSMRDKVSTALANAKIEANEIADRIEFNAKQITVDGANYNYLVHDFAQICTKPTEDFAAIMAQRIAAHKAAEAVKIEAAKKAEDARIAAAVEAERVRAAAEAAKLTANNQTQFEDQRGKANAGITMPACEQTTAAPDAGFVPVEGSAGNAASAASTPPIQQSDMGLSLEGAAGKSVRADHIASAGNMVDDEAIDDFIRLLSIGAVEKKALKVNIQKWEKYRVALLMQAAA